MIGLNTEEFTDSLTDIILLELRMVAKKGQRMLQLSRTCDKVIWPKCPSNQLM